MRSEHQEPYAEAPQPCSLCGNFVTSFIELDAGRLIVCDTCLAEAIENSLEKRGEK